MRVWRSSSRTSPSRREIEGQSLIFVFGNLGHSSEIEGLPLDLAFWFLIRPLVEHILHRELDATRHEGEHTKHQKHPDGQTASSVYARMTRPSVTTSWAGRSCSSMMPPDRRSSLNCTSRQRPTLTPSNPARKVS